MSNEQQRGDPAGRIGRAGAGASGGILLTVLAAVSLVALALSAVVVGSVDRARPGNTYSAQAFALAEVGATSAFHQLRQGPGVNAALRGPDGVAGTSDDGLFRKPEPGHLAVGNLVVRALDNDDGDGDPAHDSDGVVYIYSSGWRGDVERRVRLTLAVSRSGKPGSPVVRGTNAEWLRILEWRAER